jgi:broad specificity phosphatase PhoE
MRASALYSSTLLRAMEPADLISTRTGLEVRADSDLREWDPGDWFGLPEEEAKAKYPEIWARMETDRGFVFPGGEFVAELRDRATSVVQRIVERHPGSEVALVTHGGWIANFVWRILQVEPAVQVERGDHRGWQPFVMTTVL